MQRIVIYRDFRGYVAKPLVQKWLHIMKLISDKLFLNDHAKWMKIDSIKKDESLPFTFFKETDGNFIFRLEYQRLVNPAPELINAIEFLLIQGNVQGEKHEISGENRELTLFNNGSDAARENTEEPDSFYLLLQKEMMLGKLALLLDKVENAKECGDTSQTEKVKDEILQHVQAINMFTQPHKG
ncbi:hypothetical protein [Peribacillus deserti]|uniref:Uncharacterized protein n=1 Tax=Peribacillus deserti TaxID=673318 RepID=A0A2N5M825_9BACI|nr:hypothetical protein [Peribacillus deserti]PLT30524.1 hypothetical protein CUU66_07650 [Peribacillus deserti]